MQLAALVAFGIKSSITLTVFGLGLSAARSDAFSVFRTPSRLVQSLVAMFLVVPLFTVIVARTFLLTPAVVIALGALSVSPVPPLWPKRSLSGGGDKAYTIGLLVATTSLSVVIIPTTLAVYGQIFSIPLQAAPSAIAMIAFFTVLVPLAAGIGIRRWRWRWAHRIEQPVAIAATALLLLSLAPVLFKAWPQMVSLVGDGTLATMLAFVLVGLLAGHVIGGPTEDESTVLALASATRHPGIAMTIASLNFPTEKLVPAAILLYLLVCSIASTAYLSWINRSRRSSKAVMAMR